MLDLGLAICKALANAPAGTISAESAGKEQGATIVISFSPITESISA